MYLLFVPFVVLHRGNVKMEFNEKETDSEENTSETLIQRSKSRWCNENESMTTLEHEIENPYHGNISYPSLFFCASRVLAFIPRYYNTTVPSVSLLPHLGNRQTLTPLSPLCIHFGREIRPSNPASSASSETLPPSGPSVRKSSTRFEIEFHSL